MCFCVCVCARARGRACLFVGVVARALECACAHVALLIEHATRTRHIVCGLSGSITFFDFIL